jgi:hypothetical protein
MLVPVRCMVNFFGLGRIQQLILLLGHFFLGFSKNGAITCSVVCLSLMVHAIERSILAPASASHLARVAASGMVVISFGIEGPAPAF